MSAQGLLDSDQHKGFRVHQFSVDDYCAMVEARSLISDGIFRRLTMRGVAGGGRAWDMAGAGTGAAGGRRC